MLSAMTRQSATPCLVAAFDELHPAPRKIGKRPELAMGYNRDDFTVPPWSGLYLPPNEPPAAEPIFTPALKRFMAWGVGIALALGALANYFV